MEVFRMNFLSRTQIAIVLDQVIKDSEAKLSNIERGAEWERKRKVDIISDEEFLRILNEMVIGNSAGLIEAKESWSNGLQGYLICVWKRKSRKQWEIAFIAPVHKGKEDES